MDTDVGQGLILQELTEKTEGAFNREITEKREMGLYHAEARRARNRPVAWSALRVRKEGPFLQEETEIREVVNGRKRTGKNAKMGDFYRRSEGNED
jgi:hypothetical protein